MSLNFVLDSDVGFVASASKSATFISYAGYMHALTKPWCPFLIVMDVSLVDDGFIF